jgi:hypothetical protein
LVRFFFFTFAFGDLRGIENGVVRAWVCGTHLVERVEQNISIVIDGTLFRGRKETP